MSETQSKADTQKPAHTPGPWGRNIPPASKYPVIYAGRNTHVAQVLSKGLFGSEVEANADLIAAAPDLLAALRDALPGLRREFLDLAGKYAGTPYENDAAYIKAKARFDNARYAIAKAEGGAE